MSVLILTGASSGIGAAIAKIYLNQLGTKLIAVARSSQPLQTLIDVYGDDRVGIIVGDVANSATSSLAVALAIKKFGKLDAVIANAGTLEPVASIAQADIERWKSSFDVNFFSVVGLAKYAIPHLRQTKGKFIGVSSGASVNAYSGWGCYGATKAAMNHLILTIADDEPDIQAISIAPGTVDTNMQADIREKHVGGMSAIAHKRFTDLKKNNELLPPEVPAEVYANLALKGWDKTINGKYLRFNDDSLRSYRS